MLVLSRKCGETVRIGGDITVILLGVRGRVVKIGIDAPALIRIPRGELCDEDHPKERLEDDSRLERAALSLDC
jgi:carbon storage regulator CsrA